MFKDLPTETPFNSKRLAICQDYLVYKDGTVRDRYGNQVTPQILGGYYRVSLKTQVGPNIQVLVHRLVALMFVENPYPDRYTMVDHIDGNKLNNCAENLRWCDAKINVQQQVYQNLRTDNIGCKVWDFDTREVKEFPSLAEAKRYMGMDTRTDSVFLFPRSWGRLLNNRFEVKYLDDNTPWFYENRKEKVNSIYGLIWEKDGNQIVMVNSDEVKEYLGVDIGKVNFNSEPEMIRILYELDEQFPDYNLRYSRNNADKSKLKLGKPKPVIGEIWCFSVAEGTWKVFKSIREVNREMGLDKRLVSEALNTLKTVTNRDRINYYHFISTETDFFDKIKKEIEDFYRSNRND